METKIEVKSYKVDYNCPKCETGFLRSTGMALTTYPMQYPHKCSNCDYMETFKVTYPHIINE